jgi:shikimate dehydrogenase
MDINKDTEIYGSFSKTPGNLGCKRFNRAFRQNGINAIYKAFYSDNIQKSMEAVRTLKVKGCAISAPFKVEVIKHIDQITNGVSEVGACNTVLNKSGILFGYNTDYDAIYSFFKLYGQNKPTTVTVLGFGGYGKAAVKALEALELKVSIITRENWQTIKDIRSTIVFNCTPVKHLAVQINATNFFVDCDPETVTGKKLSFLQAERQFELYTGLTDYNFEEI